jgi:hypothetical protein
MQARKSVPFGSPVTEWTASSHWLSHTTKRTNRRQDQITNVVLECAGLCWCRKNRGRSGKDVATSAPLFSTAYIGHTYTTPSTYSLGLCPPDPTVSCQEELTSPASPFCFLYNPKFRRTDCSACYLLHVCFVLGLFYDPEDGGDMFLRNVIWLPTNYTALYPRRQKSVTVRGVQVMDFSFPPSLVSEGYRWV